ncbi:MAG: hypothetical protein H5T69_07145 [Chloroflexi bacterium]|nr:hypothetical protein [Chloroflexota bacterium]
MPTQSLRHRLRRHLTRPRRGLDGLARNWGVGLLALVWLLMGARFLLATPPFEAQDEPQHYLRVESTLGHRQPLVAPSACIRWAPVADGHPPLYYWVGALITRWIRDNVPFEPLTPNPLAQLGSLDAYREQNAVLHLQRADPLAGGAVTRLYILRLLGLLFGGGTVLCAWGLARQLMPQRDGLAWGTALCVALNPQFLFVSATAGPAALGTLWISLVGLICARALRAGSVSWRYAALLGLLAGLAALTEPAGWIAIVMALVTLLLLLGRRAQAPPRPQRLVPLLAWLAALAAVAGWWYVPRVVRGEPPAPIVDLALLASIPSLREGLELLGTEGYRVLISYWGAFGWHNVRADELYYVAIQVLWILGITGWLLLLARNYWRRRRLALEVGAGGVLPILWVVLTIAALLLGGWPVWGDRFWGVAPLSLLLCIGLTAWPLAQRGWLIILLAVVVLGVAAWFTPTRYIAATYAQPKTLTLEEVPQTIGDLHISFVEGPFLIGYKTEGDAHPGQSLEITLYWLARQRMRFDCSVSITLHGRQGRLFHRLDTHPGGGNLPARLWLPGQVIVDTYRLPIPADAEAPVAATVWVGVYLGCPSMAAYLPATDARGRYIGIKPAIAHVRVTPSIPPEYRPTNALTATWGEHVALLGYDLEPSVARPGSDMPITLYWQALKPMERDYTVFIHLVNEQGAMVAQVDEEPLQGDYPTHFWRVGDQVRDAHVLALPGDLPPGAYQLRIGLYWLQTGERLPITSGGSTGEGAPATFVTIDGIEIGAP